MFHLYHRVSLPARAGEETLRVHDCTIHYDPAMFVLVRFPSGDVGLLHGRPVAGTELLDISGLPTADDAAARLAESVGNFTFVALSASDIAIYASFYRDLQVFYACNKEGAISVSSSLERVVDFLGEVHLNIPYCADHLAQLQEFGSATFAKEVLQMELGSCLRVPRESSAFRTGGFNVPSGQSVDLFVEASRTLRAYLGNEKDIVLQFSGGLDSSFLLAVLRKIEVPFHTLHFILADEQRSPEVDIADAVAQEMDIDLTIAKAKQSYSFKRKNFLLGKKVNSPWNVFILSDDPVNRRSFYAEQLAALGLEKALFVSGHGGDDVFLQNPQHGIGFDGFRRRGVRGLVADVSKVSSLKRQMFWRELVKAIAGLRSNDARISEKSPAWIQDLQRSHRGWNRHHLLADKDPRSAKFFHIQRILAGNLEGEVLTDGDVRTIHPMLFQNLVAGVIGEPVRALFSHTHDRSILRENLASHSSISSAWRRSKRSSSDFAFRFLNNNQTQIVEAIEQGPLPRLLGLDLDWLTREVHTNANIGLNDHLHHIFDALVLSAFLQPYSEQISA